MGPLSRLPPLSRRRNPALALVLGFLFGGIGLGIYFWSWRDLLVALVIGAIVALIGLAVGFEPLPSSILAGGVVGVYGRLRAIDSNERLGPEPAGAPEDP